MLAVFIKRVFWIGLIFHSTLLNAQWKQDFLQHQDHYSWFYKNDTIQKQKSFSFITRVPADMWEVIKTPFYKKNLLTTTAVTGTTVALFFADQAISNGVRNFSDQINLKPEIRFHNIFTVANTTILKTPKNLNSAFYELGEPGPTLLLSGGLFLSGKISHNEYTVQVSKDITEAFLASGIIVQVLKRITGRQAPSKATVNGGKWQWFPSFSDYSNNIENYDAFPSGHLATMMATVTVLAEDYPEKKWIKPVGYSLIGLTGWAVMNNKVHWASDLPLGLAIGYLSGKIVSRHGLFRKKVKRKILLP